MALPLKRVHEQSGLHFGERLLAVWARSDELFDIISPKRMLSKPIVWRHPFIFYVGHLPAFSWNQICGALLGWKSFNPHYDDLFCRGIDPDVDTGECHWHPAVPEQWPTLAEIIDYRDKVRGAILDSTDVLKYQRSPNPLAEGGRVFQLVLEHEQMHQETLLYMMQQMAPDEKIRPQGLPGYHFQTARKSIVIEVARGKARIGTRFKDLAFGWDNEFEQITIDVPAFKMDSLPVTNGEFFEFVQCGAYDEPRYWRAEDWCWKELERKHQPSCWVNRGGAWLYRAMFDLLPLQQVASWPVYVSLAEARAYSTWRGKRLPTEAEFHRAAYYGPDGSESVYPWGDVAPSQRHGNFDFNAWSPVSVGSSPAGVSQWGVYELVGNGWELTDTAFAPLPGFTPYMTSYPDYSQDFFDGKHFVIKGASWATAADLLRPSFRNWYQAHYPYMFAKFRCVSD